MNLKVRFNPKNFFINKITLKDLQNTQYTKEKTSIHKKPLKVHPSTAGLLLTPVPKPILKPVRIDRFFLAKFQQKKLIDEVKNFFRNRFETLPKALITTSKKDKVHLRFKSLLSLNNTLILQNNNFQRLKTKLPYSVQEKFNFGRVIEKKFQQGN
eukprot:TRINITY_DN1234_c0_g3_i1.p4 TRINITY_DN1234_c0_g3~~TRINITY_DN1234_c0_g3_i1.p4  ORF type:complete len:155 (-),score=4.28 TRINITY_DN1234_c0_g3_i1:1205-1669(-)